MILGWDVFSPMFGWASWQSRGVPPRVKAHRSPGLNDFLPTPFRILLDDAISWQPYNTSPQHLHGAEEEVRNTISGSRFGSIVRSLTWMIFLNVFNSCSVLRNSWWTRTKRIVEMSWGKTMIFMAKAKLTVPSSNSPCFWWASPALSWVMLSTRLFW